MNLTPTNWCITDCFGGEGALEIMKGFAIGGQAGLFYAKEDSDPTIHRLPFAAGEYGVGVSKSVLGKTNFAISVPGMASVGGRIYRHPLRMKRKLDRMDLSGSFVALAVQGGAGLVPQGMFLFLGASHLLLGLWTGCLGPIMNAIVLANCEGVAAIGGMSTLTPTPGAGFTVYQGQII